MLFRLWHVRMIKNRVPERRGGFPSLSISTLNEEEETVVIMVAALNYRVLATTFAIGGSDEHGIDEGI